MNMKNLDIRISQAVQQFWVTREEQGRRQGATTGRRDYGARSSVTGGAQCDGFVNLLKELLMEAGLPDVDIQTKETVIPGFFRPTKQWDLLAVVRNNLIASIEIKSQIGSFGNNFNNRVEEALGSALDIWTAYREGVFKPSQKPWLGYLMMLEEAAGSSAPVRTRTDHYEVLPEFKDASYAKRYELFCERLMRERLYDATCLILSNKVSGPKGEYKEPAEELRFSKFATSLMSRAIAFVKMQGI